MISNSILILFLALKALLPDKPTQHNIEIIVSDIRKNEGQIVIGIYKDQPSFEKEKAYLVKKFDKKSMQQNFLIVKFTLEPGTYGFTLLDDENSDNKMEYNFLGMPEEGFGFSNYYHTGFTRPKFDSFKLDVAAGMVNKSKIKIRYM